MQRLIRIQTNDFNLAAEYQVLRENNHTGAIVTFTGLVRELENVDKAVDKKKDNQPIDALTLEHYPGMTEKLLDEILDQAEQRWPLHAVTVIHRVGKLLPTDQIVLVATASAHRDAAFKAAEFIMDYLKTRATLWKKVTIGNDDHWIDQKESDHIQSSRW